MSRTLRSISVALVLALATLTVPGVAGAASGEDTAPTPTPTTPILSARRFPGALQSSSADGELATALDQYLNKVVGTSCALVEQDGRVIYAHNADDAFAPASTLKLATALAALDILGRDKTFSTRFVA